MILSPQLPNSLTNTNMLQAQNAGQVVPSPEWDLSSVLPFTLFL